MDKQYIYERLWMFLFGIFSMSIGIALSCRADLGTSPISSVPWVLSMIMPLTFGEITILMNIVFIAVQPILMKKIYWRDLIGQFVTLLLFGYLIDYSMKLLSFVAPTITIYKWLYCLLGTVILALGVFLCVKAKIFVASGEGIVIAIAFAAKAKFSTVKNCFDITLVIISSLISIYEFGILKGVGAGTIAAAILVGRWVQLYNTHFTFLNRYLPNK